MQRRRIPVSPQTRVIVDNDFAADPDGLLALAHHLLAEASEIVGITCTSIPFRDAPDAGPVPAAQLAEQVGGRFGTQRPPIAADARECFRSGAGATPGAELILACAAAEDTRPLFVACGGPLTNVASALASDPTLAERMTLVWIGGGSHETGEWEYNLQHDLAAAQYVFNDSRVPIVQVPKTTYRQCALSIAEMEDGLLSAGEDGAWLYDRFTSPPEWVRIGGIWPMGDSPPVLLTTAAAESGEQVVVDTPWITDDGGYEPHPNPRPLTRVDRVDVRLLHGDFFARLRLHARRAR